MIGDTVAIEMPDAVSEQDQGRTIGACEAALGDDRCGRVGEGVAADWNARVTQSNAFELTIELAATGSEEATTVRVLSFSEEEPEAFRWQSVGVVVAALVLSQPPPEAEPEGAAPEPEPEPPDPAPAPPPPPSDPDIGDEAPDESDARGRDRVTIDVGPLAMSTASGAGVAGGGWLGGALRLTGPLYLVAQGDTASSAKNDAAAGLRATSFGGGLGLGLRGALGHPDIGWELSARGAVQSLSVRAASDAESGAASTTRWGTRMGLGLAWLPAGFWGVVLAGDAGLLWPPLDVDVGAAEPTRISALIWGGYLGLRIRLNRL